VGRVRSMVQVTCRAAIGRGPAAGSNRHPTLTEQRLGMFSVAAAGRATPERSGWPRMPAADEIQSLGGGRFFWQVYDPAVKTDLMSTALKAGDAWYFFDPVSLAPAALEELAIKPGCRGAILLTNANHERATREFRERFRLPIAAHSDTAP